MPETRTIQGDPGDPNRKDSDRPASSPEAETKARVEGAEPGRRFPDVPGVVLTGELGRGGMGVVYCGRQVKLGRTVAVKTLGSEYRGGAIERRFLNEGKNQARLDHPNVVVCHDSGTTREGEPYLVLEYVGGPNLLEWIREHGPLDVVDALHVALALTRALEHGLEKNLVHRDVKPENVLLKPELRARSKAFPFVPKLADFGLSRADEVHASGRLTQQGEAWGSPQTMAPEQFDGFADVDHRADIYAVGCVLHHALTGKPAFRQTSMSELRKRKRDGPPPDPREIVPGLHAGSAALVVSLLATDPDQRPLGYAELDARIVALIEELQPAARREAASRRRFAITVVLPVLALAGGAGTWGVLRNPPEPVRVNAAPLLAELRAPARVDAGTRTVLRAQATDPEGGAVTYAWSFEGPAWWKAPVDGPAPDARVLQCPEAPEPGDYELVARVRAIDAEGRESPEQAVRLQVSADAEGRPLTAPLALAPSDEAVFRGIWRGNDNRGFLVEDAGEIWARAPKGDARMFVRLPRGSFAFRTRIEVTRGAAKLRALLAIEFEGPDGTLRVVQVDPDERGSLVGVETRNFDSDALRNCGEEEPIDLRVEWDGSALTARAEAVERSSGVEDGSPGAAQESRRELFTSVSSDGARPVLMRVVVLGGDFFLKEPRIEPLPPQ